MPVPIARNCLEVVALDMITADLRIQPKDQRGLDRPQADACEIGSVEIGNKLNSWATD